MTSPRNARADNWQHETEITFRGAQRVVLFDYEGDGLILWCFEDEETCLGIDATEDERATIHQTLWGWLEDWWAPRPEDDL